MLRMAEHVVECSQSEGGVMERLMRQLLRNQSGQGTLIVVLILFILGALIMTPLLGLMGTGLKSGQTHEQLTEELYAADAGVEDAFWKIQNLPDSLPGQLENPSDSYTYPEDKKPFVNEMSVSVTIERIERQVFRVVSTASGTEVESFITTVYGDYWGLMQHVITSRGDYVVKEGVTIHPPEGDEHGPVRYFDGNWPTAEELSAWYWRDVEDEVPYNSTTLDVKDYAATGIGPLYRDGMLNIVNSGADGLTLQLDGTLYVTDDTEIGKPGDSNEFTMDLNGNTIFVESATAGSKDALYVGKQCTLIGSGCIIAVGDIQFKPNIDTNPTDYILLMSIMGTTFMQPSVNFYGTLAGEVEVSVLSGHDAIVQWSDPFGVEGGLNFPGGGGGNIEWIISTFEIG